MFPIFGNYIEVFKKFQNYQFILFNIFFSFIKPDYLGNSNYKNFDYYSYEN